MITYPIPILYSQSWLIQPDASALTVCLLSRAKSAQAFNEPKPKNIKKTWSVGSSEPPEMIPESESMKLRRVTRGTDARRCWTTSGIDVRTKYLPRRL
jgi:hypothetical protein